jgi:hypothetical protein
MNHTSSLVAASLFSLLAATVPAQVFTETFSYPNGPIVPGWTPQTGSWQIQNGRLSATSGALWSYITKDNLSATRCVIDGEFFFVGAGVQFAGLTSRHPGSGSSSNLLMVKIQNNGAAADFDRVFAYEQPVALGSFYADIPGGTVAAYCRMITLGNEFWIETDADRDGDYELVLPSRPITTVLPGTLVGMNAYQTSEMDNFEFFDAVLLPQPGAAARVGLNYDMRLATPAPQVPWFGMIALGNQGFSVGGGRTIPVSPDFIATATFADPGFGLIGVTDANGDAALSIPVPPFPFLIGLRFFAAAFTYDPTQQYGVGHISNEQAFIIQP